MKKIAVTLAAALLLIATAYVPIYSVPLGAVIVKIIETQVGMRIAAACLEIYPWRGLVAYDVEARGPEGIGLRARKALLYYDAMSIFSGRFHISLNLKDVRFYKIAILGNRVFDDIGADFYVGRSDTLTRNLRLVSDKIKISGNALTDRERNIECFFRLLLSDDIADEIPDEIRESLLREKEGAWSSVCIGIMGNFHKRALRVFTDRFKINISRPPV